MIYALGDSFTVGYGSTSGHSFVSVLSALIGQTIINKGVNSGTVADLTTNLCSINITGNDTSIVGLGTNDHYQYGNDATKLGYYKSGILSVLAYLSTPEKILGKNNTNTTGTWANTPSFGIGKKTTTPGSAITFNVSGTTIYFGTIHYAGIDGSYKVEIDGIEKGTYQTNAPGLTTALNMPCGQKALRFDGLAEGVHEVKVTAISGNVFAEWCAGNEQITKPKVYALTLPKLTTSGYAGSSKAINDATLAVYNAALSDVVNQLVSDTLNLSLVNIDNLYIQQTDAYSDGVHRNDTGHCKIALTINDCFA